MTEYNLDSKVDTVHDSTWAHGLTVAAMSLKFLEASQLHMLIHHEVVGPGAYGDIFESAHGLDAVAGGSNLTTVPWGLTAQGTTAMQINIAAKDQSSAQELAFTGAPTITVTNTAAASGHETFPSLLGWEFSGGSSPQLVILNLGTAALNVDLTKVVASGTTFTQISGDPGAYVVDGAYAKAVTIAGQPDNLVRTQGHATNLASFVVPAFSITRLAEPVPVQRMLWITLT
jgi:hypothetical protein